MNSNLVSSFTKGKRSEKLTQQDQNWELNFLTFIANSILPLANKIENSKIERPMVKCRDAFTKVVYKNGELLILNRGLRIQMYPLRTLTDG